MKTKITITGPKVHDVGYRPYLTELAMRLVMRGFEVFNDGEDGQPVVIVLLEGDDRRVRLFCKSAATKRPPLAQVDEVTTEEYIGDIMPMWQFASINTAGQMNKAIPLLLDIKKNTDMIPQIAENTKPTPQILDEVRGLREDIQPGFGTQFTQLKADVRAIKERLGMS